MNRNDYCTTRSQAFVSPAPRRQQRSLAAGLIACCFASPVMAGEPVTLKEAYQDDFRMGVAIATHWLTEPHPELLKIVAEQFNAATPENLLKWQSVHPERDRYHFADADRFVDFAEQHGMRITGHTLVWHNQTPDWVFQGADGQPATREQVLATLREHIQTVVGRYRGRIAGWDVVNEAINDDGTLRDTPWRRILGDDYLEIAFRLAHEADPDAELYYNDYSLYLKDKARTASRLVRTMKRNDVRIDGIGMQGHWSLDYPPIEDIDRSIQSLSAAAGKVMISELDINVLPWPGDQIDADVARQAVGSPELDPYTQGLPAEKQAQLANRYTEVFELFVRHRDFIDRVTFWGLEDGASWHNNWPIKGRTAHSLLFDRNLRPKPAFDAVIAVGTRPNE
ncbi:endo-1,4-beta-xylanase [Botrimarina hoheduenensis]|uniref:Beta-xylanase n=1 Tax=Botrimarina hoheduenensis TaxID=2528000 RepID=A0A5C5WCE3_9BACT|nr:endo-1,4-beta-xylanase [Botrimarina hoheduenensis]TWT47711.1 Endo-1,4-beta-xylanase A precursor [Botrimarina hoheduenensis]